MSNHVSSEGELLAVEDEEVSVLVVPHLSPPAGLSEVRNSVSLPINLIVDIVDLFSVLPNILFVVFDFVVIVIDTVVHFCDVLFKIDKSCS